MPYDPTRIYRSPTERYAARQAARAEARMARTPAELLLEAWAHLSDAELLASCTAGNLDHETRMIRFKVVRLRGLMTPVLEKAQAWIERRERERKAMLDE